MPPLWIATALTAVSLFASPPVFAREPFLREGFEETIMPVVDRFCLDCHDSLSSKGGIDLEPFLTVEDLWRHRAPWEKVLKQLRANAMPPDGEDRPSDHQREAAIAWLQEAITYIDPSKPVDPGRVTVRRLNKNEYNRTVQDLFGIALEPANDFPDDNAGYGFDNIGDVLSISPLRMEQYLQAAELVTSNLFYRPDELPLDNQSLAVFFDKSRVVLNASDRGVELAPGYDIHYPFVFPVAGEYEVTLHAWGVRDPDPRRMGQNERWLDRDRDFQPNPDLPPPVAARLFWDDEPIGTVEIDEGTPTLARQMAYRLRFSAQAGTHRLRVAYAFPDHVTPEERRSFEERRLHAPRLGLRTIRLQGPFGPGDAELTPLHRELLEASPETARGVLQSIGFRAFRRPVSASELDQCMTFLAAQRDAGHDFSRALELTVQTLLVSPHFLFRTEHPPAPGDAGTIVPVDDFALASRLSYFLWGSMPDAELLDLAEARRLRDPDEIARQVERLLADPRSEAFVEDFFGQWLELRKLAEVRPDPDLFPAFGSELRSAMKEETLRFAESILRENRSALDLLTARYTFVNGDLAHFYGIKGVPRHRDAFERVSLDGLPRRGVLTQGSVLMLTSYPNRTSPTRRGNWILTTILGDEPPPPPADVPELEENEAVPHDLPLREQLVLHRTKPTCVSCHETMDAIGFGFEHYDAIGKWRERDGETPVNASATLPTGEAFSGAMELVDILAAREEAFAGHLASKLLTFALGRGMEYYDRIAIETIVANTADDGHRLSDIIREVALSRPFRFQRGEN